MLKALSGQLVLAAQKSTSDTSRDDMVEARLLSTGQMAAWGSHDGIVPMTQIDRIRKSCLDQVGNLLARSWEISQVVPFPEFLGIPLDAVRRAGWEKPVFFLKIQITG